MNAFAKLPQKKQVHILDAATESFAEKGYFGASIKEICQRADISNGALYKYFRNKEELYFVILKKCQDILVQQLYERHTQLNHSFKTTVRMYLEQIETLHKKYPNYIRIYANLGSNNMELFSQKMHDDFMKSGSYVISMVSEAKQRNEIPQHIDDNVLAFLLDNYFILFLYSLVSDYHEKRFRSFLRIKENEALTSKKKINFILDAIEIFMHQR
ncbi:TetR/AcrR family transcriptional regulator [Virgibacillus halophilus]|uniref:TetR/AcrR family transcriptional regulator n=1 Tax=Tigheibacillus halophilus TaxID=361280 RepID=UPI00363D2660